MADIWEKSISNKLNHKLQAHARMCKENEKENKEKLLPVKVFCG